MNAATAGTSPVSPTAEETSAEAKYFGPPSPDVGAVQLAPAAREESGGLDLFHPGHVDLQPPLKHSPQHAAPLWYWTTFHR